MLMLIAPALRVESIQVSKMWETMSKSYSLFY